MKRKFQILLLAIAVVSTTASAQAPIDIERKAADGEYMAALAMYDRMPRRTATPLSIIAAAKSAWALGLVDRALAEYDVALRSGVLSQLEAARVHFAKAAIYLQDSKPGLSILSIDQGLTLLRDPSPLRGTMYVLKGQALAEQGLHPAAVTVLTRAKSEIGEESEIELNYLLGVSLTQIGRYVEAKEELKKIPSSHERAPDGIRELIRISDAEQDYAKAAMWVAKGREAYPDAFLDGWYDYLLVVGAIANDKNDAESRDEIKRLRDAAVARLPASDSWLALIVASTEQHSWRKTQPKLERRK